MTNKSFRTIVTNKWSPRSLQYYSMITVSEMLCRLNDGEIEPDFPWLNFDNNPFVGLPPSLIEEIIGACNSHLQCFSKAYRKELLQILLCKRLKKIDLRYSIMKEDDVLDILKAIEATQSDLNWLEIDIFNEVDERISWIGLKSALIQLKSYIRTLNSLSYLNVIGPCDDEMLDVIGDSCPNLSVLLTSTKRITSRGLACLCINPKNPQGRRRCQKLQKVSLYASYRCCEHLLEGIKFMLLYLPQLRELEFSAVVIGKAIERLEAETRGLVKLNLCKLSYDGTHPYSSLPSLIAKMCPFLTTLCISSATNKDFVNMQPIETLKTISIKRLGNTLNFCKDVFPFLQKMGKSLEVLTLIHFDEINFNEIDISCPNLKRLKCTNSGMLSGMVSKPPAFKSLEYLRLSADQRAGLAPDDCVRLLSKCLNLRFLFLNCCENLKEEHLETVLPRNPLTNLVHVYIASSALCIKGTDWTAIFDLQCFV